MIKIDVFQTIVGNICPEIFRFNFRWSASFFPARRTSTYCFLDIKFFLLLLLWLLLTAVGIIAQEIILP